MKGQSEQLCGEIARQSRLHQRVPPRLFHGKPGFARQVENLGPDRGVGRGGQHDVDRDQKMVAEEELARILDDPLEHISGHALRPPPADLTDLVEDMTQGGDDQFLFGREMMQLRAARHAGDLRHLGGAKTGIAALQDQLCRGGEDTPLGFLTPLALRSPLPPDRG